MGAHSCKDQSGLKWLKASGGKIPQHSFIGGHQHTGEKLYVARAAYGGGVHIGKIRPEFKGCLLGWGGRQRYVKDYEVLGLCGAKWVKAHGGLVPPHAIQAGHEADGKPLYIGRVHFKGGIHVGKIRPEFKGCNFGWGGRELCEANYEVLVDDGKIWIDADSGYIPQGAMQGGIVDGKPLYVARAKFKGGVHPGKVWGYACLFAYDGKQLHMPEYQVMRSIPGKWVEAENGHVPTEALYCGKDDDGQSLFLARGQFCNGKHTGKIRAAFEGAHISWGGKEHVFKKYEVFIPEKKVEPEF